ncbi:nucleotidyltransferase family protein [Clostridium sp.]|uniref:nucleotidyltransferase family protein n=1 Tax=Clostridium sp. TaxID=1506 RepID=UPI002605F82D|nr:nucleotidyltransferase family protein [Clostridium sp.]
MMKINVILLAAGNSSRVQPNKLLEYINSKPMYMNAVEKVLKLNFNKIILVTQYKEIKEALSDKPILVIMNEDSEKGLSYSIEIGIRADMEADAYMFMVCDEPFLTLDSITKLIDAFLESDKGIASFKYKGALGNPNIFSQKYLDELLDLEGDFGGKFVIRNHMDDVEIVVIDNEEEITDIDTIEELQQLNLRK